jgi:hypothetical protein
MERRVFLTAETTAWHDESVVVSWEAFLFTFCLIDGTDFGLYVVHVPEIYTKDVDVVS